MQTIVITSGYWNPLCQNHLDYLWAARQLGDVHYCIVNNDKQALLKKGFSFQEEMDRCRIMAALKMIDKVYISIDEDRSVCETLRSIFQKKQGNYVFANGGDVKDCPEREVCDEFGCELLFNVGGSTKTMSSSLLLERYRKYVINEEFVPSLYIETD